MEGINLATIVAAVFLAGVTSFFYIRVLNRTSNKTLHLPRGRPKFRVCGVPLDWEEQQLLDLLAAQYGSSGPDIKSLAVEIHGRSRTATFDFQAVPHQMQTAKASWQIPLPVTSTQSTRSHTLSLDDGFLGITTLYAPPLQNHKVEYVHVP
jgi:hypothetical protein